MKFTCLACGWFGYMDAPISACLVCSSTNIIDDLTPSVTPIEAAREQLQAFDATISGTTILGVKASANEKLSELTGILTTLIDAL